MNLPASMRVFERGWLSSNNILFTGSAETVLVDSGYATHAQQTVALVSHALQGRTLDRLANTHLHSDHCGGNAALRRTYACRTSIPAAEADKVRTWDEDALTCKATGQQCPRFGFDDTIAPGDVLMLGDMAWQALAAPGHDPHSLIFHCADERILISADALWENGFGVVFPELEPMMTGMFLFQESNRRYLKKEDSALAHWAVAQLVRAGAAEVQGDRLINKD